MVTKLFKIKTVLGHSRDLNPIIVMEASASFPCQKIKKTILQFIRKQKQYCMQSYFNLIVKSLLRPYGVIDFKNRHYVTIAQNTIIKVKFHKYLEIGKFMKFNQSNLFLSLHVISFHSCLFISLFSLSLYTFPVQHRVYHYVVPAGAAAPLAGLP